MVIATRLGPLFCEDDMETQNKNARESVLDEETIDASSGGSSLISDDDSLLRMALKCKHKAEAMCRLLRDDCFTVNER